MPKTLFLSNRQIEVNSPEEGKLAKLTRENFDKPQLILLQGKVIHCNYLSRQKLGLLQSKTYQEIFTRRDALALSFGVSIAVDHPFLVVCLIDKD